jgi:hypothetical protein
MLHRVSYSITVQFYRSYSTVVRRDILSDCLWCRFRLAVCTTVVYSTTVYGTVYSFF